MKISNSSMYHHVCLTAALFLFLLGSFIGHADEQPDISYNIYFGSLHNHTTLSDGDGTPDNAYTHARDVAGVDFFSIADHTESFHFSSSKWKDLKAAAERYNDPGRYVTLWGFEWSSPTLGHICVHNTKDYESCLSKPTLAGFYKWIASNPDCIATFNHPGRYDDLGTEFHHLDYSSNVAELFVGIETFNKGNGYDRYHYVNAYKSGKTYIDLANSKGWRLGATGGFDHHGTTWGSSTTFRTGVLATELTREAILDAYRARRFYSTLNKDLHLDFRCAGYPMGSQLDNKPLEFVVSAWDGSGDIITEVRLYRNGELIQTKQTDSTSVEVCFIDEAPNQQDYYYVMVSLNVGNHGGYPDEALSSPIWCTNCYTPVPELSLTKEADCETYSTAGEEITYTFEVENTGSMRLSDITVNDPLTGGYVGTITSLAPGESDSTLTTTYMVVQTDLDVGSVENTATAAATTCLGNPLEVSNTVTLTADQNPAITLTKTSDRTAYSNLGDAIVYTFTVENTGNVTLEDITVTDPLTGGLVGTIDSLAPGESDSTLTTTYTVVQADLDAGEIVNTATATAKDPKGDDVSVDSNTVTVTADQNPAITLTKTSDRTAYSNLGDAIVYTFTVENIGNVTLEDITVTDPLTGGLVGTVASLAPGESDSTLTTTYAVTQADLDAGELVNSATATGKDPNEGHVSADSNTVTVTADQNPAITLTKTADRTAYSVVGDVIVYTFTVGNAGNVTLEGIAVTDPLTGGLVGTIDSLAPGESDSALTSTYTVLQADLDAGEIVNSATATAKDPKGEDVSADSNTVTLTADQNPAITLAKAADRTAYSNLGDAIVYTFTVENIGNVTLEGITVTDPLTGGLVGTIDSLAPGESDSTLTTTYTVVQADLDAGEILNTATAIAKDPKGDGVSVDSNTVTVTADQNPAITLTKTADRTAYSTLDDAIVYTFTVENTGNVTLTDITVTDPLTGGLVGTIDSLAPGESDSALTSMYTVVQADLDAGEIVNTATATAKDPKGLPVEAFDMVTIDAFVLVEGEVEPVEGEVEPVEGEVEPVEGEVEPVEGEVEPVEGEVEPIEGEVEPVEGETEPIEGETEPIEGETEPIEGEVEPVEGEVEPAEGEVEPVEGEAPAVPHPADIDGNGTLSNKEVDDFISDWQNGSNSMTTAIRALYLLKQGGAYSYDPTLPEPDCWAP